MWNFISFCLSLWYSVDVFAHGTLASSTTSPAYRTAACYISMPSWVSLTSFRIMSFIHDDIIMLTLRPLSYSLAGSTVTQGKPRESLSPLPPSHSVCLSLSHRDTPPPPPPAGHCPPSCSSLQRACHPLRWLSCTIPCSTNETLFCVFSPPALSDRRQSSRYQSQLDEHCPFCLLSAFSFLSVSWPQPSPSHFQPFALPLLVNILYLSC